jgi:fatty-acyl-CoA synthase
MHTADLLSSRARLTPNREAIYDLASGQRCTYAQLNQRANRMANLLRQRFDLRKGDRVSILAHNSLVHIDLLYGLAKIGAIFAPLNWRLTARELAYILNDCQPRLLIAGPEFAALVAELRPQLPQVEHYLSI